MLHEKQFILVPYWAAEALRRQQKDLRELINFDTVRQSFSTSDLAGLLALQTQFGRLVGDPDGYYDSFTLGNKWEQTAQQPDSRALLKNTVLPLSCDNGLSQDHHHRLFSADAERARDELPFITYDVAPDVGAIVIYPGRFTDTVLGDLQYTVLKAILKVLYVYNTYNEVARTPWFRQYLVGLSIKQVAA